MPTLVAHLTDRDRHDLAVALRFSAWDEASEFRARRLARILDVRDLFDAHERPAPRTERPPEKKRRR